MESTKTSRKTESVLWEIVCFELRPDSNQIAFAVNTETYNIVVSSSGHPTIVRHLGNDFTGGGWLWLSTNKITYVAGYLGYLPCKFRSAVLAALCNHFRKEFRSL